MFRHEKLFSSKKFVKYLPFLFHWLCKTNLSFSSLPICPFMYPLIHMLCLTMCRALARHVIESGDVRFITGYGGTVAGDIWCAEVAHIYSTHNSQLFFLFLSKLFHDFKAWGLRSIPTPPMAASMELSIQIRWQTFTHYRYHGISGLVPYGNIYVLVCI